MLVPVTLFLTPRNGIRENSNANLSFILAIIASTFLFLLIISSSEVYADPTFRIAVTGDISCSSNGQNTVNQIIDQNPH